MEKIKALNVAIVGGGPGCKAIMDMIFAEKLSQLRMKLIGVACTNPKAVGYRYAQEKGIYTTTDYHDLYKLKNLNMIIELTGREEVAGEIFRTKPEGVRLMGNVAARLFWDIFQIEEERIAERKRADEELQKSQIESARLSAIAEKREELHEWIDTFDTFVAKYDPNGIMFFCNEAPIKAGGLTKEDVFGKYFPDTMWWSHSETERAKIVECFKRAKAGLSSRIETNFRSANGTPVPIIFNCQPVVDKEGNVKYITAEGKIVTKEVELRAKLQEAKEDLETQVQERTAELRKTNKQLRQEITGRKRTEEALRESEEKYRKLFEEARDGIFLADAETGILVDCNFEAAKLVGRDKSELIGQHQTILHPTQRIKDGFSDTFQKHAKKNEGQILETQVITSSGEIRDVAIKANLLDMAGKKFLQGIFRDITGQKLAKEVLRESEWKYRTLFEDSRDAIYMTAREGEFLDVNQSAIDLFGYTRKEMVGLDALKIYVNPDDRRRFQQEIEKRGSVRNYEVKFCKKDGTEMDCLLTATVRHSDDGSVLGYQGIIRDITEAKRLEAQLQQAQKLEAIGTLTGGIAHDFNNLLMGIQGNVSLLLIDMDSTHRHYERLNTIEKQVQSGARLTSQLLGYARKGKYEVQTVNLNQLVVETAETFGRTRKEITINRKLTENLLAIEADSGQIEQVLLNLFINAADAMPGGGELILKTFNVTHEDMREKLYYPKHGNYVLLTVTDTGAGMDKKTIKRIFDPFFTTKERGRGTGLGLASAYGIIKGHGGYIDVESKKRKGTTFSIYLPATSKKVQKVVKAAERVTKGTGTALLVDDEDVVLEVGRDLLEAMGYRVLTAKDGKEAVKVYRKNKDEIDIIVLDMVMPTMGGGEAYDHIKKINPDIKVLLSSGYSIDGEATEILNRGCNGFIQKPFNLNELLRKISEILNKK